MIDIKTLILNGSPRKNGDTAAMLQQLNKNLEGECLTINAYDSDISPCLDCRCCKTQPGCTISDNMQELYKYIEICDNIVIASPIFFSELTGPLLNIGSRFQTYYSAKRFRNSPVKIKQKKGVVLLAGGGDGNPQKAFGTAVSLMRFINTYKIFPLICSHTTDVIPASEDHEVMKAINCAADFLNSTV